MRHPDITLSLKEMVSTGQIDGLLSGELDIGILRPPIDASQFHSLLLAEEPTIAALPIDHVLADKPLLDWADLTGQPMIGYDSAGGQYLHDLVAGELLHHNISVVFLHRLSQIHSILALVRARVGIAIVPKTAAMLNVETLTYRGFNDRTPSMAKLYLVWRKGADNPLIADDVNCAKEIGTGEYPSTSL